MCKLGFVCMEKKGDVTEFVKLVTTAYGKTNEDGTGVAWVKDGKIECLKYPGEALHFWLSKKTEAIDTNMVLFHTRIKCSGKIDVDSTHPFVSEDGKIALVHNGNLYSYEELKTELEKKHKFVSDVDSEVLLHAYEEYGDDMIKQINKRNVGGSATIVILDIRGDSPVLKCYTDNRSLCEYNPEEGTYIGLSDELLGKGSLEFKEGFWYTYKFEDGKDDDKDIKKLECYEQDVGELHSWSYNCNNVNDNYGYRPISYNNRKDPIPLRSEEDNKKVADFKEKIVGKLITLDNTQDEIDFIFKMVDVKTLRKMDRKGSLKNAYRVACDNEKYEEKLKDKEVKKDKELGDLKELDEVDNYMGYT